jgi:hypothetical protein
MDSSFAVKIVPGLNQGDPGYAEALEAMNRDNAVWDIASIYAVQSVI